MIESSRIQAKANRTKAITVKVIWSVSGMELYPSTSDHFPTDLVGTGYVGIGHGPIQVMPRHPAIFALTFFGPQLAMARGTFIAEYPDPLSGYAVGFPNVFGNSRNG